MSIHDCHRFGSAQVPHSSRICRARGPFGWLFHSKYLNRKNGFLWVVPSVSEINQSPGYSNPSNTVGGWCVPIRIFTKERRLAFRYAAAHCHAIWTRRVVTFLVVFYGFPVTIFGQGMICNSHRLLYHGQLELDRFQTIRSKQNCLKLRDITVVFHNKSRNIFYFRSVVTKLTTWESMLIQLRLMFKLISIRLIVPNFSVNNFVLIL